MNNLTDSDMQTMINKIIWRETNKYIVGKATIEEAIENIRSTQEKLLRDVPEDGIRTGAKYQSTKVPSIKELI